MKLTEIQEYINGMDYKELQDLLNATLQPMTVEQVVAGMEKLKKLSQSFIDIECSHVIADSLLTNLLKTLGHTKLVEDFNSIKKWYA